MLILGLNAYHGDSAACVVADGQLLAAVEEERFRRIKHWAGFPSESIQYCLDETGAALQDVDHIAVNRDPRANLGRKTWYSIQHRPPVGLLKDRVMNAGRVRDIKATIADHFDVYGGRLTARLHHVEHHVAHLASTFFVCPFDSAAVVSVDGFGDFVGAMWGTGKMADIEIEDRVFFPHSLGIFYLALTQLLGFPKYGDEYKVMGLAAYGEPTDLDKMEQIVRLSSNGTFELGLEYFSHHSSNVTMSWRGGAPTMGPVYSPLMEQLLVPTRAKDEPITDQHKDVAASMQAMYEKALFRLLNHVYERTQIPTLCLAGGCAMNSVANGKIFENTPFTDVYIQPAAGDAGGAIGAAFYVWNQVLGNDRSFVLERPYLGPEVRQSEIDDVLVAHKRGLTAQGCRVRRLDDEKQLCRCAAERVAEGSVVGWFQGKMEWGPRALGNRSIVCDPRRAEMRQILNAKIKRRESFRPFAPSIHQEATGDYFEIDYPDPFMLKVYKIRSEMRSVIPAVTHVDGTGRLQTVRRQDNPLYWELIEQFRRITSVPVVLNTSFNENEPIVCRPEEALDCFLRTKMDVLVMGNTVLERTCESQSLQTSSMPETRSPRLSKTF